MSEENIDNTVVSNEPVSNETESVTQESPEPSVEISQSEEKPQSENVAEKKPIDTQKMVAAIAKRKAEKLAQKKYADLTSQVETLQKELDSVKQQKQPAVAQQPTPSGFVKHPDTGQDIPLNMTIGEFLAQNDPSLQQSIAPPAPVLPAYQQQTMQNQAAVPTNTPEKPQQQTGLEISPDFVAQAEWCAENIKGTGQGDDFVSVMRDKIAKILGNCPDVLNAASAASKNGAMELYELAKTQAGITKLFEISSISSPDKRKYEMFKLMDARERQRANLYTTNASPQPTPLDEGGNSNDYFNEDMSQTVARMIREQNKR